MLPKQIPSRFFYAAILPALLCAFVLPGCGTPGQEVAVIGGADGPTGIYTERAADPGIAELNAATAIRTTYETEFLGSYECGTVGYTILGKQPEEGGGITVYAAATFGGYGFENGIFSRVAGTDVIYAAVRFSLSRAGEYLLDGYEDASTQAQAAEIFPQSVLQALDTPEHYQELLFSQELEQAEQHLQKIGREAEVEQVWGSAFVREDPVKDETAARRLREEFDKYPYWTGTREFVEAGTRYVYEKIWEGGSPAGDDIAIYRKINPNTGEIIEAYRVEITGPNVSIEQET